MVDIPFVSHLEPPYSFSWSGLWPAGTPITVSWTSVTVDSPCGSFLFATDGESNVGGVGFAEVAHSSTGPGSTTYTPASDVTVQNFNAYTEGYCSGGTLHGVTITGGGAGAYCAYGTSAQSGITAGIIITTALIDAICIAYGVTGWILPIFDGFVGKVLWGGDLCSGLPPVMPTFTNADFLGSTGVPNPASLGKFWTALEVMAWPYFCQCNPGPVIGDPPPVAPPNTPPDKPDAAPDAPVMLTCDTTDVCIALNQLARLVTSLSGQIAQMRSDVTLIQRQGVPFGYVPSTLFSDLSGDGELTVSDILALSVEFTTIPTEYPATPGDPDRHYGLGKLSLGTADGWQQPFNLSVNPQLVNPLPGDVTKIGYSFSYGVVANVQTFVREP